MKAKSTIFVRRESSLVKITAGIVLALATVASWLIWYPNSKVMLVLALFFSAAFIALGFFRLEARTDKAALLLNILWGIVCVLATILSSLPIPLTWPISVTPLSLLRVCINVICAFFVVACVLTVTASWKLSVLISSIAIFILLLANNLVFCFRGNELSIGDFTALGTALNVVGQYKFQVTIYILYLGMSFALAMFSQFSVPRSPAIGISKSRIRSISAVVAVVFALVLNYASAITPLQAWSNLGTTRNGYLLNFVIGVKNMRVEKPDGYSPDAVEELNLYFSNPSPDPAGDDAPNIIVIMNESFADLNVFSNPLNTNIPVTPFIDSLSENTIKGYALSSVFGGKTANSEFELITGHTMAFFPSETIPYQQYIKTEICSLPQMLRSYGYSTLITHPYFSSGWSRTTVYPKLGFDRYTFLEDYPQEDLVRAYVSDREMYNYILNQLDTASNDGPAFVMGITMQNHGGYQYSGENYTQTVQLEGYSKEYPEAEQYLSLLHESDRAVEYLLTELQNRSEKTIVLFFGDHQPKIETAFYETLNGGKIDTLEERMLQYTVPFFIWANYEIESKTVSCTSLNYLPCYLLENAGLELPTYYRALSDFQNTVPAINAAGYYSLEKGKYLPLDEAEGTEADVLRKYRILQYNNVFDDKNKNQGLFAQYITP